MIVVNHLCFTITEKRDSFEVTLRVPDGRLRLAMTERTGYLRCANHSRYQRARSLGHS